MKRAFEMKLYENKSDEYIAEWLNEMGFNRETLNTSKSVNDKALHRVRVNPFYY